LVAVVELRRGGIASTLVTIRACFASQARR